ncbi:polysaccharide biosynthesis/export family protein [Aliiruegeria lutimaris]|uniref:Polysaccharide export outer membrane protein n=1 Tax=Aliiruegeria lutimaris TaxID=571298 RepID=A0A1G8R5V4_9RHOB|nr:polysaccharide biosynthesis/export family protein [Aliiruegeria lutimaris]SDJ12318.1 polysaccharide export outer membrane protein [Aliiruegeria lutimaris]
MIIRLFIAFVAMILTLGSASAQGNYLVKPGDTLRIEILEDTSLNRQVLVLPDGNVSFPMAGTIRASGKSTEQIARTISSKVASNFAVQPTIYVSVADVYSDRMEVREQPDELVTVYLVGEVNTPGPKEVEPGTTFLQLLSQSGGFTKFAATKRLQLRRTAADGRQSLFKVNYKAISQGAMVTSDPVLVPGDVILVPERRLFE